MAALRSRGLAARFVSGYRRLSEDEQEDQVLNGGNTHAWLQAYIPGPGWVDFDPSAGTMGNENLVRVGREGELGRLAGTFPGPLFCPSGTREDSADPQCKFVPVMRFPMRVGSQRP
jgi:transglutaminase-like putative cysteine protease